MASIGGVELRLADTNFSAGAAFRLADGSFDQTAVEIDGELVLVDPGAGVVVVFVAEPIDTGVMQAHEAAQRALDVLAYRGVGLTSLVRAQDECVMWWRDEDGVTIRALITRDVGVSFGATLPVVEAGGAVREPTPEPSPSWSPALRFLRYAQIAEDAFDAYRNAFLALEAVLSERVAPTRDGEKAWLGSALRQLSDAGEVDLTRYVSAGVSDPVDQFIDEQWEAKRCATFHAKGNHDVLLPGSAEDRDAVTDALKRLLPLVIALTEKVVGARHPSGGMTALGFEGFFISPKVGKLEMHVESESGESVALDCKYVGRPDEGDATAA